MSDRSGGWRSRGSTPYFVLLVAVIALTAAVLRAPFLAVAPVAREIGMDLGVSAAVVGLLTSIPVLCFAVFAPAAVALVRRGGADFALTVMLIGTIAGCLLRVSGGIALALIGTALMGVFLTVGNIVIPVIISREFTARRAHTMTGIYTSALNVGTMTVTLATAPLADVIGWRWALASWACFAVAALACWIPLRGLRGAFAPRPAASAISGAARGSAWRHRPTLLLAVAFAGQAFAFYGVTAWLPSLLADEGFSGAAAGAIASIFQVAGIAGSLLIPVLTMRASLAAGFLAAGIGWLVVPLGFLFAPAGWLVWTSIGGVAQGAGITVVFIAFGVLGPDVHTTAGRSGLVQAVGYGVSAAGPLALGGLHESTGSWTVPLVIVLVAVVVLLVCGTLSARMLQTEIAARSGAAAPER
ncbi:CynX/NimT family MFS transporter [Microbacterium sp.]|uniref:MFS transporter n=1 Tax=Microbacterium sp. TaxID=51671 RepID=UPI002D76941C|nr:MFS transporter [Microbacterium sp.]HET6301818.1 MFS transporter [Microbacterium sp.]